jgi:hypothetical protein
MYLKPAASDAGAATIVVYSIAPASSREARIGGDRRALLADGDVDAAHLLLRVAGGPGLALVDDRVGDDRGLAGLPVTDDSWRWPRPIGVMASMALMPVCSGSCTDCRCTTVGACSSRARRPVVRSGRRRRWVAQRVDDAAEVAVADRPRRDLAGAADLLALLDAGVVAEDDDPTSRTSRFRARPRTPLSNSSSSLVMTEGRPSTRAMPSPASVTIPTSSRETSGSTR